MLPTLKASDTKRQKTYYGWTIIGVAFLIGFTQAGVFQNVLSIFLKPISNEFGWNRSTITGSIAVGSLMGGLIAPFFGPYLDRHGPRKIAFWGILVLSCGLIALHQLSSVWQLYLLFGSGRMISSGILSLLITVTVSNWFINKRGRAMGIAQLGSRFGIAVFPLMVQFLIAGFGWRQAWVVLGLIVFSFSAFPSLLFLKRKPEDIGLFPDGIAVPRSENHTPPSSTSHSVNTPFKNEPVWDRTSALKTPVFWILTLIISIVSFVSAGSNFHLFPFLTDHGTEPGLAAGVISVISVCSALGGVIIGFMAEHISVKKLLAADLICLGLIFYLISQSVHNIEFVFTLAAIFGLFRGGAVPLTSLIWVEFFGRQHSGAVISLSSPFRAFFNAAGPLFASLFFDLNGHYELPFTLFAILLILAGLISCTAKTPDPDRQNLT